MKYKIRMNKNLLIHFRSILSDYFVLSYHCFIKEKITLYLLKYQYDFIVNTSTHCGKCPTHSLGFIFFVCLCDHPSDSHVVPNKLIYIVCTLYPISIIIFFMVVTLGNQLYCNKNYINFSDN